MDIELLSEIPEQTSTSFSSNLLQDSPSRLITPDTTELFDQNPFQQEASPTSEFPLQGITSDQTGLITTKIAEISGSIVDCITGSKAKLEIHMKSKNKQKRTLDPTAAMDSRRTPPKSTRFPSRCTSEARRFAVLHRILELSNSALVTGTVTTKRDIYYQEPELFTTQSVVDRYVDDISHTLGVNRNTLNVVAAAKGLIVGDLIVTRRGGSLIKYSSELDGLLVPRVDDVEHLQIQETQWVLVVEKEATFRTLAACAYWQSSSAGTGILITAKGYPDIQTRQFLYLLSTNFPHLPIFALVDWDPDGIGIMSTYKHGSKALAHETNLNVPSIRWLGVRSSDATTSNTRDGVLPLTKRDRSAAKKMLQRQDIATRDQEWRRELQLMLMLNMKAEIQILGNEDQLGVWLDRKLSAAVDEAKLDDDGDMLML